MSVGGLTRAIALAFVIPGHPVLWSLIAVADTINQR